MGLGRISRLLQPAPQTWKAIHVAGSNGKGSICAWLSALISARGVSCARFTSPHLVDRWDCITVKEKAVSEGLFREVEETVRKRDKDDHIGASEFELLTATAFEIFNRQRVQYGVVEVGMGGELDATNAMKEKTITVISKIGLDHQGFLGSSLEEIALHKAGIMRANVPCVVDSTNPPSVLRTIENHANKVGAEIHYPSVSLASFLVKENLEAHQAQNLACALEAFRLAFPDGDTDFSKLVSVVKKTQWPGRLQMLDISMITGRTQPVLLDGAHNTQSAEVLAAFVRKHVRPQGPVTWVLASSQGKDMDGILGLLLQPLDQVAAVRFGPIDGMPWVKAANTSELLHLASQHGVDAAKQYDGGDDVGAALRWACAQADGGPLVIAGSLYLVSSILRFLREL